MKGNAYKLPSFKLLFNEVPKDPHPTLPVTSMSLVYLLEIDGKDSIAEDITYPSHSMLRNQAAINLSTSLPLAKFHSARKIGIC